MGKIGLARPDLRVQRLLNARQRLRGKVSMNMWAPFLPLGGLHSSPNFLVELSRTIAGNLLNSNLRARSTSLAHFNLGQASLRDHAIRAQIPNKMDCASTLS